MPAMAVNKIRALSILIFFWIVSCGSGEEKEEFDIEGEIHVYSEVPKSWITNTRILVNGGEYVAYPKPDGSFVVYGVNPGKHDVIVENPWFEFERVSIQVTGEGTVIVIPHNPLTPNKGRRLDYPLVLRERKRKSYFEKRETWSMKDVYPFIQVLPLILMAIPMFAMQKYINAAPEDERREMNNQMRQVNNMMGQFKGPDVSVWLTKFFAPYFGPEIPPNFGEEPEDRNNGPEKKRKKDKPSISNPDGDEVLPEERQRGTRIRPTSRSKRRKHRRQH